MRRAHAVIAKEWQGVSDGSGRRRLENPEDLVRLKIATALARNIRVIPALAPGARVPLAIDLPEGLKALARRSCVELSDIRLRNDAERLIEALQATTPERLVEVGSSAAGGRR